MNPTVLDVALVVALLLYAVSGYRRGLVATVVGMVGLLAGAALCLWLLPGRLDHVVPSRFGGVRPVFLVAALLFFAGLGQFLALRLTRRLRAPLHRSPARVLDSLLGAVLTTAVAALMVWFVAGVLRVAAPQPLASALGQSRMVRIIDSIVPSTSDRLLGRVVVALNSYGFPRVFDDLAAEPIAPVDPGDPKVVRSKGIVDAARSVVRIDARAVACGRDQEGTGFVAGPNLVVTNAHVVAGSERVTVRAGDGRLQAGVVAFDPQRDLAVLSVPDLNAAALPLGPELERGDQGAVAGYPLAGPYRVDAVRVRAVLQASGDDIYGNAGVHRQVYSLRAQIHPGNSGGPLMTTDGRVAGVVFARSLDDASTAYALTLAELRPVLDAVEPSSRMVGTGGCAS